MVWVFSYCVQLFWWVSSKPSEKRWAISPKGKHKLSKTTFSTFQKCLFELSFAFSFSGNYKKCFETFLRSLLGTIRVFCFQMQSHVSAAPVPEGYVWYFGSVHPAFEMSSDTEYLEKNSFWFFGNVVFVVLDCVQLFWWFSYKPSEKWRAFSPKGKHQLSKMTLSTFQKCLFELCFAFFFGCNKNIFLMSLYLEQYVFFVQMQSHVLAALFFERYVRYFGSLHPAFEMSRDTEYLEKK